MLYCVIEVTGVEINKKQINISKYDIVSLNNFLFCLKIKTYILPSKKNVFLYEK